MLTARFAIFYFTYFAGLGVMLPYFNLYFEKLGMSGVQIGILSAIVPLGKIVFPTVWAYHADRSGQRRRLTRLACFLCIGAFALYLPVRSFTGLAAASLVLAMVDGPRLPMVEAASLDLTRRSRLDYGRARGWGSIGFIASVTVLGAVIGRWEIRVVLYAALLWAALNWVSSLALPDMPHDPDQTRTSLRRFALRPVVVAFFAGCMLMQASHGAFYAFFSIHLERNGYTGAAIGALWGLGVMAEVGVMFFARRAGGRLSPVTVMIGCAILAAVRWSLCASSALPAVLVSAQVLHAFTFGAFHIAAVTQTHRFFPSDLRASGQSLFGGLTYGLGTVVGSFGSGVLFDTTGPWTMFGVSAFVALASAASLVAFRFLARAGRTPG